MEEQELEGRDLQEARKGIQKFNALR